MAYSIDLKTEAIRLRQKGYSIKEIAKISKIAVSTSSEWLSNVELPPQALKRLEKRQIFGQYKARMIMLERKKDLETLLLKETTLTLSKIKLSKNLSKLICALIYWCEGNKDPGFVRFTNSDPTLIELFLSLLRKGFAADESKLRALVHIHEYHNEDKQKEFWCKVTKIPLAQFNKSYIKPHTGKRKHAYYPGCIAISYYDTRVAKELLALYNAFTRKGASVNW